MVISKKLAIIIENPVKSGNCPDWFTLPPTIFLEINYLIGFQIYIPQNLGFKKNKTRCLKKMSNNLKRVILINWIIIRFDHFIFFFLEEILNLENWTWKECCRSDAPERRFKGEQNMLCLTFLGGHPLSDMEYCASAWAMLAEHLSQIVEGYVELIELKVLKPISWINSKTKFIVWSLIKTFYTIIIIISW